MGERGWVKRASLLLNDLKFYIIDLYLLNLTQENLWNELISLQKNSNIGFCSPKLDLSVVLLNDIKLNCGVMWKERNSID